MTQIEIQSFHQQRRRYRSSSTVQYGFIVVSLLLLLLFVFVCNILGMVQLVHANQQQLQQHQQYGTSTNHLHLNRSLKHILPTTATTTTTTIPAIRMKYSIRILLQQHQLRGGGGDNKDRTTTTISTGSGRSRIIHRRTDGAVGPVTTVPSTSSTTTTSSSSKSTSTSNNNNNNDSILQIINLIKTIIGAGILGIPAGMVHSFYNPNGNALLNVIVPTTLLFILIGLLAAYGFYMIGEICSITNSTNYAMAWNATLSSNTMILPNMACIMVTFCTLLTYSMVLADTIPTLIRPILQTYISTATTSVDQSTSIVSLLTNRNIVLVVMTIIVLLPLCLLQSLKSLAPFSFIGICGIVYTAIIMIIRYFDQSYNSNGFFLSTIESKL
jgi:hypothetical protein